MKVLVTGATGFIGRQTLPRLTVGDNSVHAVYTRCPLAAVPRVIWHQTDLMMPGKATELIAEVRPTHLLHLAWHTMPGDYWTSEQNLHWLRASQELIEAFRNHGGERLVAAGTCAEYDWENGVCSEAETPIAPLTLYGTCKAALGETIAAITANSGLSAAWGRIFFLYGPYEHPKRLVASVSQALLRGEPAFCSHGQQQRDFLFVEDVADAFVALLRSDICGNVNIGSGQRIAVKDIIRKIALWTGKEELVQLGAYAVSAADPPLIVADISRLRDQVGWQPGYTLDQGLARTIAWWKHQQHARRKESKDCA